MAKIRILKTRPIEKHWLGKIYNSKQRNFQFVHITDVEVPIGNEFIDLVQFDGSNEQRDALMSELFKRKVVA